MSLRKELEAYIAKKGNSPHDVMKKKFFREIIDLIKDKKLTVERLTEKLASLKPEDRELLFWLGSKAGKSPNSQAALWVAALYRTLNVPLDDISLAIIVAEDISGPNKTTLIKYNYHFWQKNRLSKEGKSALDRELKGLLGVDGLQYQHKSLAQSLEKCYESGFYELERQLERLSDVAPEYIPQVVSELYNLYIEKPKHELGEEKALQLIEQLVVLVNKNQELFKPLSNSHPQIAAALIKQQPRRFFELSQAMQQEVHQLLHQEPGFFESVVNFIKEMPFFNGGTQFNERLKLLQSASLRNQAAAPNHENHELFVELKDKLYERLAPGSNQLIAKHQAISALEEIDAYLLKGPNKYKTKFFQKLATDIAKEGLTVEVLNKHLGSSNKKELFASWGGAQNSRAAGLMFQLYKLANMTSQDEDVAHMRRNLLDPQGDEISEMLDMASRKKNFLEEKIDQVLRHPEQTNNHSPLEKKITEMVQEYEMVGQFAQQAAGRGKASAEAIYHNYLVKKGLAQARANIKQKHLIFDPQGHVIIPVKLDEDDYAKICALISNQDNGTKKDLEKLLGTTLTTTTLCNLDIAHVEEFRAAFKEKVDPSKSLDKVLDDYLSSDDRTSVSALQAEMMMHVSLSLRGLEQTVLDNNPSLLHQGQLLNENQRAELMAEINTKVLAKFKDILQKVSGSQGIDYIELNKQLDEARIELAAASRQELVNALFNSGRDFTALSEIFSEKLDDHAFTSTTATGWDFLWTDISNESAVHISATEKTAHDKKIGAKELAVRVISRSHYNPEDNSVAPYEDRTVEARVPSIAVKSVGHATAVQDVAAKLKYVHEILVARKPGYTGPVVYNLLTSLHSKPFDTLFDSANRQRASAARIMKGSHLYNWRQLSRGEVNALVYVQNIPVNQHTNELSYTAYDGATREAAVMTDLALLATFNQHAAVFPPALRQSITATFNVSHTRYLRFLPQAKDGDHYFKDSVDGKWMMEDLIKKKAAWKELEPMTPAEDMPSLAVQALFKIMANNEHQNKQFGMLAQSLSVYVEEMSLAGCKSANEREQAVAGRVGLLKSINPANIEKLSYEKRDVIKAMADYVSGTGSVDALQQSIDSAYNKHNLHGAVASVSMEDQAAASKVKATRNKKRGVVCEINTNYAESGFLERLSQNNTDAMQAHKAHLATEFKELCKTKVAEMHASNALIIH
ncbi:hypothetical protein [Legionella brunensis]|uniref:Uncharacterized protein n=1 Tax=Legionella brunensis TaxID=29422 RepID=A0A0W0RZW2_9GAMM|nr:hypothetical protein [Legionella brunensis]KTC76751.1 hypothetical protein Lbru_2858 [Legionella brunensis]